MPILCEIGFGRNSAKFSGTVRVFLYLISCTRTWRSTKCRSSVFIQRLHACFFVFLPRF